MAYVLGYLYADGNVMDLPYMRAKYVSVTSIDIDSIKRIQAWLGSSHRIIERASQWEHGNKTYTLRIGSHALYDSLFHLGLRPRKSLTVTMPEIPSRYFMDFVRGYFDGDGCVYLEKITRKNGLIRPRKLSTIFTSGSKAFLDQLSQLLDKNIETKHQKTIRGRTAYQLRYGTNDSIRLYRELYKGVKKGDYLERKHKIFEEFFRLHKRPCGEDSNATVCKTVMRGCKSHHGLQSLARPGAEIGSQP